MTYSHMHWSRIQCPVTSIAVLAFLLLHFLFPFASFLVDFNQIARKCSSVDWFITTSYKSIDLISLIDDDERVWTYRLLFCCGMSFFIGVNNHQEFHVSTGQLRDGDWQLLLLSVDVVTTKGRFIHVYVCVLASRLHLWQVSNFYWPRLVTEYL